MKNFYYKHKPVIEKWLLIVGLIICLYIFIAYAFAYIAPFVIGFLISLILDPIVNFLQRKLKISRSLLAFFTVAITAALIIFVGTRTVISIFGQATSFIRTLPMLLQEVRFTLDSFIVTYQDMMTLVSDDFQIAINSMVDNSINSVASWATSYLGSGVKNSSGSIVKNFPQILISIFFTIISAFFFIKDKYKISDFMTAHCHPLILTNYRIIKNGVLRALTGYLKAQLIIMTFTAIICITGLTVLNYQYALLVGLVTTIMDGLPIVGSGTVLIPWALVKFMTGDISMGVGLLVIYGIITVTRQTLEPKILGEQIGVYPLITLVSIYIGIQIFGLLGFLLGPVTAVTVKVLNESWPIRKANDRERDFFLNKNKDKTEEDGYV